MNPVWIVAVVALAGCGDNLPSFDDRVLIYTRTLGYRHSDGIKAGLRVLPDRLAADQVSADTTEDPAAFTDDNLARYRAVLFFYTTGDDILDPPGKVALEAYVRGGGGFMGVHSATDTEYQWPFYQDMIVAHFASHPDPSSATLHVEDRTHPTTALLPEPYVVDSDEWYNFATNPRATPGVHILVTIDETTYTGGTMGPDHPMVWCHERLGGRVFYTQLSHGYGRWDEPLYVDFVAGAVLWTMHRAM